MSSTYENITVAGLLLDQRQKMLVQHFDPVNMFAKNVSRDGKLVQSVESLTNNANDNLE